MVVSCGIRGGIVNQRKEHFIMTTLLAMIGCSLYLCTGIVMTAAIFESAALAERLRKPPRDNVKSPTVGRWAQCMSWLGIVGSTALCVLFAPLFIPGIFKKIEEWKVGKDIFI